MNNLAWNNEIGLEFLFCWFPELQVMIDRDGLWGHSYSVARGEILGFTEDELMRKHLSRTCPLIKNESWGLEVDQIPT